MTKSKSNGRADVLPKLKWGDFMDLPNSRSCGYGSTPVGGYHLKRGVFVWEMWPCGAGPSKRGKARTWQAAKAAVNKAWRNFWQSEADSRKEEVCRNSK